MSSGEKAIKDKAMAVVLSCWGPGAMVGPGKKAVGLTQNIMKSYSEFTSKKLPRRSRRQGSQTHRM